MAETQRTRNPIIIALYCAVLWSLTGQVFLLTVWPNDAGAAEFMVLPSLSVSEEYNDNVFLTRYNKIHDYITRAIPAFSLDYKTSFWNWHLDAAYDYRYYARGTKTGDSTYHVNLTNHTELINNLFFIDVLDTYDRYSLNTARDFTQQSLFVNQTDTNIFTVNPYFMLKSESRFTPVLGYKYVNTWYKDPSAISTVDHIGYAELLANLSSNMTFTIGAQYTHDENRVEDYNNFNIYAGPKYTYAPNSYVYGMIGQSYWDFQFHSNQRHVIWEAGFNHTYSTSTVAFQTKSGYIHDPTLIVRRQDLYVATITKTTPRNTFTVSAGLYEYRNATTNHLENTNYILTGTLSHAISPTLTLLLNETVQRLEDNQVNTVTSQWLSGVTLQQQLAANFTLTLDYRYTNSYSPDNYFDNYVNNRVIIGLTKRF